MPRLGAVTRSMTRAGTGAGHSTPDQAVARGAADANMVDQMAATTLRGTMNEIASTKPLDPSSKISDMSPSRVLTAELLIQNRMTILRLEQDGILAPGILTINTFGELCAEMSVEPDTGTMAGLFPNMAIHPDTDEQIPSWLRDYLVKILNVHSHGPPAVCRAFYDHLKDSQGDVGINNSVRTAESHLSYATISLRYAIDEVKGFLRMRHAVKETYHEEAFNVIKTVKRLIGYEGESMPKGIRMLIEIAEMGAVMKEALDEPLESLVVTPYTQLLEKLELVSKALRVQLDRVDQETDKAREGDGPQSPPDSGIDICWR